MKKLITTAFVMAGLIGGVSAQQQKLKFTPPVGGQAEGKAEKAKSSQMSKADIADWYNHLDIMAKSNVGSSITNFVGFLAHDTIAKFITETGANAEGRNNISIGQVLDPKDDLIDQTDNPAIKLSRHVSFKVDSIRFTYLYARQVDSIDDGMGGLMPVMDTLFIAYWKGNITKSALSNGGAKLAYPTNGWINGNVRMPSNYLKMDTILFGPGEHDSTRVSAQNGGFENAWQVKSATYGAPAGMSINALNGLESNNLVAAAVTFKSGIKTVIGTDTAVMVYQKDPSTLPPGTRRTNYFGYYYGSNQSGTAWTNPTYYNTSLLSIPGTAYAVGNGWNGYVSGNAFTNDIFIDFDFRLTTTSDNVGITEINNDAFAMSSVYPNPAKSSDRPVIAFNLKNDAKVSVSIINLVGQEVKAGFSKSFESGAHAEFVDVNGLKAGVYFVTMTVNGSSISKKLTITE